MMMVKNVENKYYKEIRNAVSALEDIRRDAYNKYIARYEEEDIALEYMMDIDEIIEEIILEAMHKLRDRRQEYSNEKNKIKSTEVVKEK